MISDDDLLLYYYRDGLEPDDRARIGAALANDPELAQRLHRLIARLDAAAASSDVPVPAAAQQRWQAALERAASADAAEPTVVAMHSRAPVTRRRTNFRWLAAAAAIAAVALVSMIYTRQPAGPRTAEVALPPDAPGTSAADGAAYERGLKWHLASTERQLASLESATPEQRARLVDDILAQNRIFALAAERAGEPQLARVLRAFGPVLESVAQGGGESSANIAQLEFELRVMQGRLGAGAGSPSNTTSL